MPKIKDKVCVVTGGAGSIGLASARLFADEGAQVSRQMTIEGEDLVPLFGARDENLRAIEEGIGVQVAARGGLVRFEGDAAQGLGREAHVEGEGVLGPDRLQGLRVQEDGGELPFGFEPAEPRRHLGRAKTPRAARGTGVPRAARGGAFVSG